MGLLECKVCGYRAKQLHQHLKAEHQMTSKEYRSIYGNHLRMQVNFNPDLSKKDPYISKYIKRGYSKRKGELYSESVYNRLLLKDKLLKDELWKRYLGRSKYRTMIKDDKKLYASIMFYTQNINTTLENRMRFIIDFNYQIDRCYCSCGRKMNFKKYCRRCPELKRKLILDQLDESLNGHIILYNKDSIPILERVALNYGVSDLRHAENGGEERISYFSVDGYSKEKNIVFEFDESYHFRGDGRLREKDLQRQRTIIEKINCRFIRINEQGEVYYDSER